MPTAREPQPLVSDEEIIDILDPDDGTWSDDDLQLGKNLVALVRKRLAERLRDATADAAQAGTGKNYVAGMREAARLVEED